MCPKKTIDDGTTRFLPLRNDRLIYFLKHLDTGREIKNPGRQGLVNSHLLGEHLVDLIAVFFPLDGERPHHPTRIAVLVVLRYFVVVLPRNGVYPIEGRSEEHTSELQSPV